MEQLLDGYDESSRDGVQLLVRRLLREGVLSEHAGAGPRRLPADLERDHEFAAVYERCAPVLMGSSAPMAFALYEAVRHVVARDIPGAFVECGVWRGGNPLLMVLTLQALGVDDRELYLYDAFDATWPDPDPADGTTSGMDHEQLLANNRELRRRAEEDDDGVRRECSVEVVRQRLVETGYPSARIHLIQGYVEQTLPARAPERAALLRLDTDLYRSTKHELETLYPRLSGGGVLIVDDYPTHTGATQAVDEYFQASGRRIFLSRIDTQGRIGVKEAAMAP
ncbi:TylF/MycF/NovP-related O-methyltransferase [Haliangium sp.]|uniref:TylF/MycF/NovP-related O-methyltransferase n=1 Tax=Haliangium sp. TaxID=2663208 RepID=UPI003D146469